MITQGDVLKVVAPDKTVRGFVIVDSVDKNTRMITATEPMPVGIARGDSLELMAAESDTAQ